MAKETSKKTEPKVEAELPKVVEPIKEEVITESIPVLGDEPPATDLQEVKEVEKVVEALKSIDEPIIINLDKGKVYTKSTTDEELSMEQRIINFIETRSGEIRLNEFLKSLFPIPTNGEPSQCLQQGTSRMLRSLLEDMQAKSQIVISENRHRLLGQSYYPDSSTGKQEHYNLNTLILTVKK